MSERRLDDQASAAGLKPGNRAFLDRLQSHFAISPQMHDYLTERWGQTNLLLDQARAAGHPAAPGNWRPMPRNPRNYETPWDCTRVLIFSMSPATSQGHIHMARWAIPYEGATPDRCWWETNLGPMPGSSPVVPEFVTHWMPLPEWPAADVSGDVSGDRLRSE